ncbi:MAG TPA: molybdopterin cofactor-binding domain-containing protein [Solirubrobacteraceae bacterium]|jgi:isoquinoline 1-oxidoreductase beta subunit|nr:molybdopterin cofactor-binding domain-containing protein [Solirubrobacteraceae bacterium]
MRDSACSTADGVSRRRFIGYLLAGPTLIAAAQLHVSEARAAIPTIQPIDLFDLSDLLNLAAAATSSLIKVVVGSDGTVSFELPRAEVGQGLTTAVAMTIADELGVALDAVQVSLSDARPELEFNQLTGGSNSLHSIFTPVRMAAASARTQLVSTASRRFGVPSGLLSLADGLVTGPGVSATIGSLTGDAAVISDRRIQAELKPAAQLALVGTAQPRIDAHDIVTGRKVFAMDLNIPGALPTMVCRPPTINGTARTILNRTVVENLPGVTDVAIIPYTPYVPGGVAVRAQTFGQCIDAIEALRVDWGPGTVDGKSDASVLADLHKREELMTPQLPGTKSIEQLFTFYFRPGDPLETNCAVADVTDRNATVWSSLKSPVVAQEQLARDLGLPNSAVTVHVTQGGGSFGRHLFSDAAFEAAAISQKLGKPVKLMWARTDNFRQGRVHPMCTSRIRISYAGSNVIAFDQRHTSVATDFSHGFGEIITAFAATIPGADSGGYANTIFTLTQNVPYNFGLVTQALGEIYTYDSFNTSSVRNIYSPDVVTATELMTDQIAAVLGQDPYSFRRAFVRDPRMLAVLEKLAEVGNWGRPMPAGTAQGIAIHNEYKGRCACLVEIDCRPATVRRTIASGFTGPRVTKVVVVVDVGMPINTLGLQAQMMGGAMDGIAQVLSYSLHLQDGHYLEGSWDNAYYTRQWNTPGEVEVIVMPATTNEPGGAGELGVSPAMAATACAYARATGTLPTSFPINHNQPLGFTPYPTMPPIPQSPVDGLKNLGKPTAPPVS